jgi:hypothetical protein
MGWGGLKTMDGEKPRVVLLPIRDSLDVGDEAIGDIKGPTAEGIRRSDSEGHSMASDVVGENVRQSFSGPTLKNEERTLKTCRILISRLNAIKRKWGEPEYLNEGYVDCRAVCLSRKKTDLLIQVTKANVNIWDEVAREAKVSNQGIFKAQTIADASEEVWKAICDKTFPNVAERKGGIPIVWRPQLILALEAVDFPVTKSVISKCLEIHEKDIKDLGFKAVWLVGPSEAHTYQLA